MNALWLVLQRVGYAVVLLVAVLVLNFTLINLAPGDIADTIAGDMGGADPQVLAEIRQIYGLDRPIWEQLLKYVWNAFQLDFGYSFFFNVPVIDLLAQRVPPTLLLVVLAQFLAITVGVLLGVIASRRPNGVTSHLVTLLALFGYSAPIFWTGIMLLILFSLWVPIFPVAGMIDVLVEGSWVGAGS